MQDAMVLLTRMASLPEGRVLLQGAFGPKAQAPSPAPLPSAAAAAETQRLQSAPPNQATSAVVPRSGGGVAGSASRQAGAFVAAGGSGWTTGENDKLRRLVKKCGRRWPLIGSVMMRSGAECREQFNLLERETA